MSDSANVFHVESWAGMCIGPEGHQERYGACAEEAAIPPALRRRMSTFARLAVACGLHLAGKGDTDLVLASQYGDLALSEALLADVVAGGLLSPAAFSQSVHNAPAGTLDILRGSRVGHTAIAAGAESLSAGLIEAWLRLRQAPSLPVVLVYADEVPAPMGGEATRRPGIALGLRLSAEAGAGGAVVRFAPRQVAQPAIPSAALAQRLIACLARGGDGVPVVWQAQGFDWAVQGGG